MTAKEQSRSDQRREQRREQRNLQNPTGQVEDTGIRAILRELATKPSLLKLTPRPVSE
jgi:hypothetical protein